MSLTHLAVLVMLLSELRSRRPGAGRTARLCGGAEGGARTVGRSRSCFSELWDDPNAYRGRHVSVRGKVVRVFRAPARGSLPARVEIWLDAGKGNLICCVLPDGSNGLEAPVEGRMVLGIGDIAGAGGLSRRRCRAAGPAGRRTRSGTSRFGGSRQA